MVNTLADHRYKGHAQRCVRALCQRLFSLGMTPFVHIGINNKISIRFFEKLGFRKTYTATYIVFSPS